VFSLGKRDSSCHESLCRDGDRDNCLTAPQVEAVKLAYAPAKKSNGELIYPGLVPGGEADWPISAFNGAPDPGAIDLGIFRYVAVGSQTDRKTKEPALRVWAAKIRRGQTAFCPVP
jgi:hypothetical protein